MRKEFLFVLTVLFIAWLIPLVCCQAIEHFTYKSLNRPTVIFTAKERPNMPKSTHLNL